MDIKKEQHQALKYFQNSIIKEIHKCIDDKIMFKFRHDGPAITTQFLLNNWFSGDWIFKDRAPYSISI